MNRIRIWCPNCKSYESVIPLDTDPNVLHAHSTSYTTFLLKDGQWKTRHCGEILKDAKGNVVIGIDGLKKVLVEDRIWSINNKTRVPPDKSKIKMRKG